MRIIAIVCALVALTCSSIATAQVKDTSVAEVVCRSEGFAPQTLAFGKCVLTKLSKLEVIQNPAQQAEGLNLPSAADPYSHLKNDYARASAAYYRGSYNDAYIYMLRAARAGDRRAYVPVAQYYLDGIGISVDPVKGVFWLRKAEQVGDVYAYPLLAQAHLNGQGVSQDIHKAYRLMEAAQNAGAERQFQEIEMMLKQRAGEDALVCVRFGMQFGTSQHGQCRFQLEQARQQAEFQQKQYELQVAQYQQQQAAYDAQQEAIRRERNRRQGEALLRMSQGMLNSRSPSLLGGVADGLANVNGTPLPQPVPPQPPSIQNYAIRLPSGNQVYCQYNSMAKYMSCR
jgi:TPR repeat protein